MKHLCALIICVSFFTSCIRSKGIPLSLDSKHQTELRELSKFVTADADTIYNLDHEKITIPQSFFESFQSPLYTLEAMDDVQLKYTYFAHQLDQIVEDSEVHHSDLNFSFSQATQVRRHASSGEITKLTYYFHSDRHPNCKNEEVQQSDLHVGEYSKCLLLSFGITDGYVSSFSGLGGFLP